jgi:hypothetical protein
MDRRNQFMLNSDGLSKSSDGTNSSSMVALIAPAWQLFRGLTRIGLVVTRRQVLCGDNMNSFPMVFFLLG